MRNTGQLESSDLAPLPSLEATSSTPPTMTLEGNNVESTSRCIGTRGPGGLSQGDFAGYVWWGGHIPENLKEPENLEISEKKLERTASYSQSQRS